MKSNKIDIAKLKDRKKEIYSHLWENKEFDFNVVETGKSDKSYAFEFAGDDLIDYVGKSIANNFQIENEKDLFLEKFRMVCSGDGDELKKITTLHSSSLCTLLFFFNISENKPLCIKGLDGYKFTQSIFEFKNAVIRKPSNIDVVLLGKNKSGENVILFLESKFSEYITGITKAGKKYNVRKSYFDKDKEDCYSYPIYKSLFNEKLFELDKSNYELSADSDKYIEGIKQMISHYYGIRNFLAKRYYKKNNDGLDIIKKYNAKEFLLGEILFDNFGDNIKQEFLDPYEKDYEKLAQITNNQLEKEQITNFRVLEKTLKYSDLKGFISSFPVIKDFYFPNQNNM